MIGTNNRLETIIKYELFIMEKNPISVTANLMAIGGYDDWLIRKTITKILREKEDGKFSE